MQTFIAGESYAGQYIPYIADAIFKTTVIKTPLKGLMIGNGWISPREQYPAYLEYLVQRGIVKEGSTGHASIQKKVDACMEQIAEMDSKQEGSKGMVLIGVCEDILGAINGATRKNKCVLLFTRVPQFLKDLCLTLQPLLELVRYDKIPQLRCRMARGAERGYALPSGPSPSFLGLTLCRSPAPSRPQRPDVVRALHAEDGRPKQWEQCSGTVGSHFWTPNSVPAVMLLPQLLEKIPILLFAGENDLMCAGVGIERMIEKLEWNGEVGFVSYSLVS